MKYIRTKDGIYEVEEWFKPLENDMVYIPKEGLNKILKQADNIEELCDALYFVEDEDNCPHTVERLDEHFDKDKKLTECCLEIGGWVTWLKNYHKKGKINGAIFTSKGIIYVAEMDEKGDWELL